MRTPQASELRRISLAEAKRAALRAAQLEAVTIALARAITPEQVAEVTLRHGIAALGATTGLVNLLTADRQHLRLAGAIGYDQELRPNWPLASSGPVTPTTRAILEGQAVWIETAQGLAEQYPQLAANPSPTGNRAFVALPLQGIDQTIGVLSFSFAAEQSFGTADRAFMQTLARHGTLALERAQLYMQEHLARTAAESAQARLTFLAGAGRTLAMSLDYETTLRSIANLLVPGLADWCILDLFEAGDLRRAIIAHIDPARPKRVRTLRQSHPVDDSSARILDEVLLSRHPLLSEQLPSSIMEPLLTGTANLARLRRLPTVSRLIVPLAVHGELLGALTLIATESRRTYLAADLDLAEDLAYRIALALDNSRLYQSTREASEQVRQQATRLQGLAEASHEFSETTLHLPALLEAILRRITGSLGDSCIICRLSPDGQELIPLGMRHTAPEKQAELARFLGQNRLRVGESLQGLVARTGDALIVPRSWRDAGVQVPPSWMAKLAGYTDESLLIVPLRRGKLFGTLTVSRDTSWPEFTVDDQRFLQDLADRVALAIDNSDLHQRVTDGERELQTLVQKLITAQEEERRRVAYEIHDGLAQVAVAAHQHLQAYAHRYTPRTAGRRDALAEILHLAQRTVDEARRVIANLRPTVLDDFGLASALGVQIATFERQGWEVTYCENLGDERLTALVETALFRVAQEALNNSHKHAQTTRIRVDLERHERGVTLMIRDWGRGFVPGAFEGHAGPGERVGLPGMRERITLIGGQFQIDTAPGAGTLISASVPLA